MNIILNYLRLFYVKKSNKNVEQGESQQSANNKDYNNNILIQYNKMKCKKSSSFTWNSNPNLKPRMVNELWPITALVGAAETFLIIFTGVTLNKHFEGYIETCGHEFYPNATAVNNNDLMSLVVSAMMLLVSAFVYKHRTIWYYLTITTVYYLVLFGLSLAKFYCLETLRSLQKDPVDGFNPHMEAFYVLSMTTLAVSSVYFSTYLLVTFFTDTKTGRDIVLRIAVFLRSPAP